MLCQKYYWMQTVFKLNAFFVLGEELTTLNHLVRLSLFC